MTGSVGSPVPAGYAWEPTNAQLAERYGVSPDAIVRFDLNTSPSPPALAQEVLARGRFAAPLSEYPPSDYRDLVEAAAARYGVAPSELLVGAGADEVLDICAKAFLGAGDAAVVPSPSYAMYPILTEQRPARLISVPRRGADEGYAMDVEAVRAAALEAALVWLCSPNNPTALSEPDGAVEDLLGGLSADADRAGRRPPAVVLDEAYAEFAGTDHVGLRDAYERLVVVRTLSKAYALAGARVGFAIARRGTLAEMEPYRPPGSVSVVSVTLAEAALRDPMSAEPNLRRVASERQRLAAALGGVGWTVGASVTNFLLVDLGSRQRAEKVAETLLRQGLVPRTFGRRHPLAGHLRFTVRSPWEDDRLIEAARAIGRDGLEPA